MSGNRKPLALVSVLAMTMSVGCSGNDTFLMNNDGVPVALDLPACEILAMNEFEPSDESRADYSAAVSRGTIIRLTNHVFVKPDGVVLNFENKHLVPWVPTGPITVREAIRRHIGVYQWVTPTEGPYSGKRVCASSSMSHGSYPLP
jgi:hypothetical protein